MDAQALLDLIRVNEEAPGFDLSEIVCGTSGCLVGNFCIARPKDRMTFDGVLYLDGTYLRPIGHDMYDVIALRFGITRKSAVFLFCEYERGRGRFGEYHEFQGRSRDPKDRYAAINRVRKFLYYKLHKQELCYEDDGRVKESARRAEGDHRVASRVLNRLQLAVAP